MTTSHDDLPHPIPPVAQLRWKENWLFVLMAPAQRVFGLVHVNTEPTFDRARFTCNLNVEGRVFKHAGETRFPEGWETRRELGDSAVTVRFVQPHQEYALDIETADVSAHLRFEALRPTFDFAVCRSSAPHNVSFRELMTLGTNLPHDHQQQALVASGELKLKGAVRAPLRIEGFGYRDHSWCMRADALIAEHTFCGLLFPTRTIGVKTATMMQRPGTQAREGYVSDAAGARVLSIPKVVVSGEGPDGLGEAVRFELQDVFGAAYTVEARISERHAHVPLISEKPGAAGTYRIVENLCPIRMIETGEEGLGYIELGLNPRHSRDRP